VALLRRIEAGVSRRARPRALLLGFIALAVAGPFAFLEAHTAAPTLGSQGLDTSLPLTESAATVRGRGRFADLEITVNQTKSLINQAVSITWKGGTPTATTPGAFSANFLQIMQCWGEDDGMVPSNPGPPPEQCVQGAVGSIRNPPANVHPESFVYRRVIGLAGQPGLDMAAGVFDPDGLLWRPFRSVTGAVVDIQEDPDFVLVGKSWLNPFFNGTTTNEISGARTDLSGRGAELFEVHTGLQSTGLGCGQAVLEVAGAKRVPRCWIVIVPRGEAVDENEGTGSGANRPVATSPLAPSPWSNRIAIPIEFVPVESPCQLGADERRLAGGELIQTALVSWQPALCSTAKLPPFSFAPVSDSAARQQIAASTSGGPGMVIVSRPLSPNARDPKSPVVYAPLGVSALVIGFNVERFPRAATSEAAAVTGVRVAELNLTPRLVAKLLTQSYASQVTVGNVLPSTYAWATKNPLSMGTDPDFFQFNPEFELLNPNDARTFGGLQLPAGTSDAAQQVWEWVLADPEAKAWLNGQPDQWGMKVNPVYLTDATQNPSGQPFANPIPATFPKSDPYCFQAETRGANNEIVPPPLCGTDWMPYSRSFSDAARIARIAFDGARIVENPNALTSSDVWARQPPQIIGSRAMLALTDLPSAKRYGLQVARLSHAGDVGPSRQFVGPTDASMVAGVRAMRPGIDPLVLQPAPGSPAPGAYPLTTLSYAAIKPLALDAGARRDYAAFLDYATGTGQIAGRDPGLLPPGYTPLPSRLRAQAWTAAIAVRGMIAPTAPTTTTTTTTTTVAGTQATVTSVASQPPVNAVPTATPPSRPASTSSGSPPSTGTLPTVVSEPPVAEVTESSEPAVTESPPTTEQVVTDTVPPTSVAGGATPKVDLTNSRFAVAGVGALALFSAYGALAITKRDRRALESVVDANGTDEA
jgi:hypothetical protein